jgi:hypothetical protein
VVRCAVIFLIVCTIPILSWAENDGVVPSSDQIHEILASFDLSWTQRVSPDTVLGDVIFEMDVQTPTGDNQLLGIEFDGTHFYVTGGNGGWEPNKVYVIDTLGNVILVLDQPDIPDYWGWRDLVWDGVYTGSDGIDTLYGSCGTMVHKFGIRFADSTLIHYGFFLGPAYPLNRALAFMEDSAWFFTSSGDTSDCNYKFSKASTYIDSCQSSWFMYGAAYDCDVSEGGYVWWHSQDSSGTPFYCLIEQMDAFSMDFTNVVFSYVPSTITSGLAGGLCFYEGFRGMDVLFALVQGNPTDIIVGIFIRHHQTGITEEPRYMCPLMYTGVTCSPNPLRDQGKLVYCTPETGRVLLRIYNRTGCLVRMLVDENEVAGTKVVYWDGKDMSGGTLPNGIYFATLETLQHRETAKIVLLR